MEPIETERLLLRPLVMSDLNDLYQLYSQQEIMQYITGEPRTRAQTASRLRSYIADREHFGFGYYAAIYKATNKMIGRCGLEPVLEMQGLAGNIAWMFLKPYWGQGLATEFARAAIPYSFAHFPLTRISASADRQNIASIRVMQKAGMRFQYATAYSVVYEIHPDDIVP